MSRFNILISRHIHSYNYIIIISFCLINLKWHKYKKIIIYSYYDYFVKSTLENINNITPDIDFQIEKWTTLKIRYLHYTLHWIKPQFGVIAVGVIFCINHIIFKKPQAQEFKVIILNNNHSLNSLIYYVLYYALLYETTNTMQRSNITSTASQTCPETDKNPITLK